MDYMKGRQNVLPNEDIEKLNSLLEVLVDFFGIDFLESEGYHPLKQLWRRPDALAINELLNFSDALSRLQNDDRKWLADQIKIVKDGQPNNMYGAIFEIISLGLFDRSRITITPAGESNPGYDATVTMKDTNRTKMVISIKNHGISSNEQTFQQNAAALDNFFYRKLKKRRAYRA